MRDLRPRVGARDEPLRALVRREHHIDGDIPIGVAVHLNARPMHALDPCVQVVLRFRDIALVRRRRCRDTAR